MIGIVKIASPNLKVLEDYERVSSYFRESLPAGRQAPSAA